MIASLAAITATDALAYCESQGGAAADCQAEVNDHMVGGAYCDGDVVLSLDAAGNHVSRCIPLATVEAKIAIQKASYGTQYDPAAATPGQASAGVGLAVLGGVTLLAALGIWGILR